MDHVHATQTQCHVPFPEPVILTSRRPNATDVVVPVPNASVYENRVTEAVPSFGGVLAADITVTIGCDTPGLTFIPLPRDLIQYRTRTYTILTQQRSWLLGFHTLTARDIAIASRLEQLGNLLRSVPGGQDKTGKQVFQYSTVFANIPCRVQPQGGQANETRFDARAQSGEYRAILNQQIYPLAGDVWQVGQRQWGVMGYGNPELLGQPSWLILRDEDEGPLTTSAG